MGNQIRYRVSRPIGCVIRTCKVCISPVLVEQLAREHEFPLRLSMEPEDD